MTELRSGQLRHRQGWRRGQLPGEADVEAQTKAKGSVSASGAAYPPPEQRKPLSPNEALTYLHFGRIMSASLKFNPHLPHRPGS